MPQKIKTLTLTGPHQNPHEADGSRNTLYRVEKITDSTDYAPGQFLPKAAVDILCAARDWRVSITAAKEA